MREDVVAPFDVTEDPSVGRIVHYVASEHRDGGFTSVCRAAIITVVQERLPFGGQIVGLVEFTPIDLFFTKAPYNEEKEPGTWHWPEPA